MIRALSILLLCAGCSQADANSVRPVRTATAPRIVPWIYPAGIDPNRYVWVLEGSTNLQDWYFICPNTNKTLGVRMTQPFEVFRLRGTPIGS